MFVSTDKGESWQPISSMPTTEGVKSLAGVSVFKLVEDVNDSKALYWASRQHGLFYSFDDGKSWAQADSELNSGFVRAVAVHPQDKCKIYASNGRQVFRSNDCTRSWTEVFYEARTGNSITSLSFDPNGANTLYLTESNGDMLKSVDEGKSWAVDYRFSGYVREIVFDNNKPGHAYVVTTEDGLYRTKDGAKTWENLAPKLENYPGALEYRRFLIYPSKAEQIYWISQYGVLTSRNAGEDWEAVNLVTPPGSVDIYGFAVNASNDKEMYYTGTIDYKSTFYRSADGGKTWETRKLPSRQLPTVLRAHPDHDGWLYLGYTIPPKE
jgi:photosystem II stability/assembly factor-like uncharacterized protein